MAIRQPKNSKPFLARLPKQLHALVAEDAKKYAAEHGGQRNMNRALVIRLLEAYEAGSLVTPEQRKLIRDFIDAL